MPKPVVCTLAAVRVLTMSNKLLYIQTLTDIMPVNSIYDIANMAPSVPERNVLFERSAYSTIGFLQFYASSSCPRCLEQRPFSCVCPLT